MKFKEIKIMQQSELKEKLKELHMDLIKFNSQRATGTTLKSPGLIKETRKTIARIKSVLQDTEEKKE